MRILMRSIPLLVIVLVIAACSNQARTQRSNRDNNSTQSNQNNGSIQSNNNVGTAPSKVPPTQTESVIPTTLPTPNPTAAANSNTSQPDLTTARSKIKHIVIIMQENRSFDQYFGTYPGADGIPMQNGVPTVCVNDPQTNQCVKPYHNTIDINSGGPHGASSAAGDINGGKMDGFIAQFRKAQKACKNPDTPGCAKGGSPDVMGWHDAREIPNYWAYAQNFVLQDKMFEPNSSWSLPSHLFMVSGWSATCSTPGDAASCVNALDGPQTAFLLPTQVKLITPGPI